MKAIQLYLPTLFKTGKLTYEHIDDARGLLSFYVANLMQLEDYLLTRAEHSTALSTVSSITGLLAKLNEVLKNGLQDIEQLTGVICDCPDLTHCRDMGLPWRFIQARLIYRQVSRGAHPVIRLYRQYEYLFCHIERSAGSTLYRCRNLF